VSLACRCSSASHQALVAVVIEQPNILQVVLPILKTESLFGHIGNMWHSGCEQHAWEAWEQEGQQGPVL